jgi:hypothetical protein
VLGREFEIDQTIVAPCGDDPVVLSLVTITNRSSRRRSSRWIEAWGCEQYQFSYRALMEASVMSSADAAPQLRRDFNQRFESHFELVPHDAGLVMRQRFLGPAPEDEARWSKLQASLTKNPNGYFGGPVPPLAQGASMDDTAPPAAFLVSLNGAVDGFSTDAAAFFGSDSGQPAGARTALGKKLEPASTNKAFLLERNLTLEPGQSGTLAFLYGYLPDGFTLDALIARYREQPETIPSTSAKLRRSSGITFRVESEPWVEREIRWNTAYLRSGLTYDSFFGEHILSQGAGYEYLAGLQGAARDPLQHALPLIFTDPGIVRGILRYTLKEIQPDGSIPYGIVGSGVPMPCRYRPSDLDLWVLWLASEYVLATRDKRFLDERLPVYPPNRPQTETRTVAELLQHCFVHLTETVGPGQHGLQRLYNGDWNDSIVVNRYDAGQVEEIMAHGESVLNSAMASWVLDEYARMLDYVGLIDSAARARSKAAEQRQAVRDQWNGRWFRRAWLGRELGWCGEKQLWLEPQPWALLGGCATEDQARILVRSIDEMSRRASPIGAMLQSPADPTMRDEPGTGTNGGIFVAINATLIWALAGMDGAMAWDEWKKNSFARHAELYPDDWFGIWSGPDAYDSILAKHPGSTAPDFPVLNMHAHAWPMYTATKLLGLEFDQRGLLLKPVLPEPSYEFSSPLFGLRKAAPGRYTGWYAPSIAGSWTVVLELPEAESGTVRHLAVNGAPVELRVDGKKISFTGSSAPGSPFRWEIR